MLSANEPTPMAPEEAPKILQGMCHEEIPPPTKTPTDQEKGRGTLLLGTNAAGDAIVQLEILSDTAPVVVIPMKGDGDKQCEVFFL